MTSVTTIDFFRSELTKQFRYKKCCDNFNVESFMCPTFVNKSNSIYLPSRNNVYPPYCENTSNDYQNLFINNSI